MEFLSAGVIIQELQSGARPISGVSTSTLALLGKAERGPVNVPVLVTSMSDFSRIFGNAARYRISGVDYEYFNLWVALSLFFANGGTRAYIVRLANTGGGAGHIALKATASWASAWTRNAYSEGIWGNRISDLLEVDPNYSREILDEAVTIAIGTGTLSLKPVVVGSVRMNYTSGGLVYDVIDDGLGSLKTAQVPIGAEAVTILAGTGTLAHLPVAGTLHMHYTSGGNGYDVYDNGLGVLMTRDSVPVVKGTVVHATGVVTLTDATPTAVTADYYYASVVTKGTVTYTSGVVTLTDSSPTLVTADYQYAVYKYTVNFQSDPNRADTSEVVESYDNLDLLSANDSRYFPNIINSQSAYVGIVKLSGGVPSPFPTLAYLTGGAEGDTISTVELSNGLAGLDAVNEMMMVVAPDSMYAGVAAASSLMVDYCDARGDCFAILETPSSMVRITDMSQVSTYAKSTLGKNTSLGALYHPWVRIADPLANGALVDFPPAAAVAGIYARTDNTRNVGKAPAGITDGALRGIVELTIKLNKSQRDAIYPNRVNPLISEPQTGTCVWGARTLSLDPLWKYIQLRRLFQFVGKSTYESTHWVCFENNNATTRTRVRLQLESFLLFLFNLGYFAGNTPSQAFFVVCDDTNNPQSIVDQGLLLCDIAIAGNKPGEFIVFRLSQKQSDTTA